jgi:hypothetical protein
MDPYECHGTSPGNGSVQDAGIGEGAADAAALDANNGWIDIEMVKTLSRPLHNNRIQTELNPSGNRASISSKKMR